MDFPVVYTTASVRLPLLPWYILGIPFVTPCTSALDTLHQAVWKPKVFEVGHVYRRRPPNPTCGPETRGGSPHLGVADHT